MSKSVEGLGCLHFISLQNLDIQNFANYWKSVVILTSMIILIIKVFFLCTSRSLLVLMLSSSLAPISRTISRLCKKYIFTFNLQPLLVLSGKEAANSLLCRERAFYVQDSNFRTNTFTWCGSIYRYNKSWWPSLGEGCHLRSLSFLSISSS